MLGAIAGDIIGSRFEAMPIKTKSFDLFHPECRFTDDSVLTVAVAHAILDNKDYVSSIREIGRRYPNAGYGGFFMQWLFSNGGAYNSFGNGAAMRVSPVGFAFDTKEKVLTLAAKTAKVTHNHPEGIKGAQATALAVFLARTGYDKEQIRQEISSRFHYNLNRSLENVRPHYHFDVTCQGSVPESIIAFLESTDVEDAIRNAISLGGDSDTMACIAGGIAEAFYGGLSGEMVAELESRLPDDLWKIAKRFCQTYYDASLNSSS